MEQSKLKDCPFCGGKGELCECCGFDSGRKYYLVQCVKCEARTVMKDTPGQARDLWELRV